MSFGASFLGGLGGGSIGSAAVKLYLDTAQYQSQLAGAEAETKSFGLAASAAYSTIGTAAAAFAVASIKAASEHEQVLAALTAQVGSATGAYEKQATALQQLTGYEDEQILAADTILSRFKLTNEQVQASIPTILDYARASGKSVPDAAKAVGKALLGNTRALKEVGISYKSTGDATADFNNILGLLNDKVGGQASAYAETFAGKLEILKATFNDLEESVGGALIDNLTLLVDLLNKGGEAANNAQGGFGALGNSLGDWVEQAIPGVTIGESFVDILKAWNDHSKEAATATTQLTTVQTTAGDAARRYAESLLATNDALEAQTERMQEQRLAQLQLVGGTIGLIAAQEQLAEDERTLNRLRREGKVGTDAWNEATAKAITDAASLRIQERELAQDLKDHAISIGQVKAAIKDMGTQAGLSGGELNRFITSELRDILGYVDKINNQTVKVKVDDSEILGALNKARALASI